MGDGLEQPVPFSAQVKCCGWVSFYNWTENAELMNRINITYPCSCKNKSKDDSSILPQTGFCEAPVGNGTQSSNNPDEWPVYKEVCGWLSGRAGLGAQWVQNLSPPGSLIYVFTNVSVQGTPRPLSAGPPGWGWPLLVILSDRVKWPIAG